MNSPSARSLMTTMMLFAVTLSFAPWSSRTVISITMANAGTWTMIGIPATRGAVCNRPCTSGFELRSAVRYPVDSHAGIRSPNAPRKVLK
jgi:hypothetical protein